MKILKIELILCKVLEENEQILKDIDLLIKGLIKEIGWHYFVDIAWVISWLRRQDIKPGTTILDAGAGNGLLQFLLSYYGYNVISVDFSPRNITVLAKLLFNIEQKETNSKFSNKYISHLKEVSSLKYMIKRFIIFLKKGKMNIFSFWRLLFNLRAGKIKPGKITIYQADMQNMSEILDNSVDAVVSVSAIEHMEIDSIKLALTEFYRILKPNQPMIITTSASKSIDWFHKPSKGWCFSLETLSDLFGIDEEHSSDFNEFDKILSEYQNNSFLKNHLASFYFVSGKNGMPNGIWKPQYLPVGIITTKTNV